MLPLLRGVDTYGGVEFEQLLLTLPFRLLCPQPGSGVARWVKRECPINALNPHQISKGRDNRGNINFQFPPMAIPTHLFGTFCDFGFAVVTVSDPHCDSQPSLDFPGHRPGTEAFISRLGLSVEGVASAVLIWPGRRKLTQMCDCSQWTPLGWRNCPNWQPPITDLCLNSHLHLGAQKPRNLQLWLQRHTCERINRQKKSLAPGRMQPRRIYGTAHWTECRSFRFQWSSSLAAWKCRYARNLWVSGHKEQHCQRKWEECPDFRTRHVECQAAKRPSLLHLQPWRTHFSARSSFTPATRSSLRACSSRNSRRDALSYSFSPCVSNDTGSGGDWGEGGVSC